MNSAANMRPLNSKAFIYCFYEYLMQKRGQEDFQVVRMMMILILIVALFGAIIYIMKTKVLP